MGQRAKSIAVSVAEEAAALFGAAVATEPVSQCDSDTPALSGKTFALSPPATVAAACVPAMAAATSESVAMPAASRALVVRPMVKSPDDPPPVRSPPDTVTAVTSPAPALLQIGAAGPWAVKTCPVVPAAMVAHAEPVP